MAKETVRARVPIMASGRVIGNNGRKADSRQIAVTTYIILARTDLTFLVDVAGTSGLAATYT